MTLALPAEGLRSVRKLDLSWPVLILFAALLCVLIILPVTWLVYYSFVDRDGTILIGDSENHRVRAITPARSRAN